jgi:hypothetical protein
MGKLSAIVLAFCIWVAPYSVAAADFDGSTPLLCAVMQAFECSPQEGCQASTAEIMNLPQFLRIDFEEREIEATRATGDTRTSSILHFERFQGNVIMQGSENARGWSMIIAEETGKMSASALGDGVGFLVFGACTPP